MWDTQVSETESRVLEGVVIRKRGEGKFRSCMKALAEIKVNMKFKDKTAIPKGISHSMNYINKDS